MRDAFQLLVIWDTVQIKLSHYDDTGLIPGLRPANETRHYKVTPSLIGWAQT